MEALVLGDRLLDMTKRERVGRNFLKKVGDYLVGIIILVTFAAVFY